MDTQVIKDICMNKWTSGFDIDKKTKTAIDKFDTWISQIPDEHKELSLVLIQNLEYYPRSLTNKILIELHEKLMDSIKEEQENVIYAYIKSTDGKTNSSDEYWSMYKILNDLNLEFCYENLNCINNFQWEYVKNIVFIDDFSGTGKSFIKELKKNENRYIGKNIYFITICIMKEAIETIEDYAKSKKISITPIFYFSQSKAFDKNLFEDNTCAKEQFLELTSYLKISKKQNPLGFNKSEALVAFHNNTPNNTLSIIWCDTDGYESLFPRRNQTKPRWDKMKEHNKERRIANYNNKSI